MDQQDTSISLALILIVGLLRLGSGQWQVIGPEKPILVLDGEDVVFSCFLSPQTNAEAMEVRFFKDQFSAVVHLYRDGEDQPYLQMAAYRERTEMVKDSIVDGLVSLRLKEVTLSDSGFYGCWFNSQSQGQEAVWELQVAALGSTPLVSVMGYVGEDIQLLCKSSGWFPQPTVKWKDAQEHELPSDSKVTTDMHGLFDVETSLIVQENTRKICSIQHSGYSQKMESRVLLGEMFFKPSPWYLPTILLGLHCFVLCAGICALIIFFLKHQKKLLSALEWREAHEHAVELTLDPDSAHPQLYISDLKAVAYTDAVQHLPYSVKRFKKKCVVAFQGFQEGKHYWEVEVGQNKIWNVGVCRDDVDRKRPDGRLSPKHGYWVLKKFLGLGYFTYNPDLTCLRLKTCLTRVGVFLNYEDGSMSFFNVNDKSLIYTLKYQFEGLLRPCILFQLDTYTEENMPIVICPVPKRPKRENPTQKVSSPPNADNMELTSQMTTPFLSQAAAQGE